jgi:ribosome-associated heat shock protein Hsp15
MRIDKFLWCVRLFKTRSISSDAVRSGKVLIAGLPVKASREVKQGEEITIKRHGFDESIQIIDIPKNRVAAKLLVDLIKDITSDQEIQKREFLRLARNVTRKKGLGRPTKKDRRDLDDLAL